VSYEASKACVYETQKQFLIRHNLLNEDEKILLATEQERL
jgi:hypothetical protein